MVSQGSVAVSDADPWAVQSRVGLSDARLTLSSLLAPSPGGTVDYRSGVLAAGDNPGQSVHRALQVTTGGNMAVTVDPGNCIINTPQLGAYLCALPSVATLELAPSSSTTNRVDLVVARVEDDHNAALGSASGVRRFTVEVWQGDGATGTPVEPEPTVAYGWIPLAAVRVDSNTTEVAATDITDRRGPALTTRGGLRVLHGPDAAVDSDVFAEPGSYPGEQRWVHGPGFQHQVYYGDNPDDPRRHGWRGVTNMMVADAYPPPGDTIWVRGWGTSRELCRATIKDPGVTYMVYPTARCYVTLSSGTSADFRIRIGSASGPMVNWHRQDNWSTRDRRVVPNIAPMMYGPLNGDTDIVLDGVVRDAPNSSSGFSYRGYDSGQTRLYVVAVPDMAQPPEVG